MTSAQPDPASLPLDGFARPAPCTSAVSSAGAPPVVPTDNQQAPPEGLAGVSAQQREQELRDKLLQRSQGCAAVASSGPASCAAAAAAKNTLDRDAPLTRSSASADGVVKKEGAEHDKPDRSDKRGPSASVDERNLDRDREHDRERERRGGVGRSDRRDDREASRYGRRSPDRRDRSWDRGDRERGDRERDLGRDRERHRETTRDRRDRRERDHSERERERAWRGGGQRRHSRSHSRSLSPSPRRRSGSPRRRSISPRRRPGPPASYDKQAVQAAMERARMGMTMAGMMGMGMPGACGGHAECTLIAC